MSERRGQIAVGLLAAIVLSNAASAAADEWVVQRQMGPIEVRSESALQGPLAEALNELPALQADLSRMLGVRSSTKPIELNLFATTRSYRNHLALRVPGVSNRVALFNTGVERDRVYAVYTTNIAVDLRHECTHAFLHSRMQYVPLWLDEGIAEYFEVPAEMRATRNPHLRSMRRFRPMKDANLTRLESLGTISDMGPEEYRESWAWVHFMIHGPQPVREVLRRTIAEITETGFSKQIRPKLAAIVGDPEAALQRHIRSVR